MSEETTNETAVDIKELFTTEAQTFSDKIVNRFSEIWDKMMEGLYEAGGHPKVPERGFKA